MLIWSQDWDDNDNTMWEAPSFYSSLCWRLKQELRDDKVWWVDASDEELRGFAEDAPWLVLAEAQQSMVESDDESRKENGG